jgi:hypothetical protein
LVNTDAGSIAYYRGFHIGHAWSICPVFDLTKMLVTVSVLGKLELGILGTLGGYLLAALLQVRILVAPTIVILLLGKAVLDLVICVTAIEAKVVGSSVSSNFLFRSIGVKGRFLGLIDL